LATRATSMIVALRVGLTGGDERSYERSYR
jgi:hypothetical protein